MNIKANKFYKKIASGQICIHTVEDPTIYKLDLTSSVGEIITSDVDLITINAVLTSDSKDITDKCSNVIWRKYIYDLNVAILDTTWGSEFEGLDQVELTTEEIYSKCKIECEMYLRDDNNKEKKVAINYITLIDINDLRPTKNEPPNPKDGDLWLDMNFEPPLLKVYLDGKWIRLNEEMPDIEGLIKDLKAINTKVTDLKLEVDSENILSINNKKDYLFDYFNSLTSTNGESPYNRYKKDMIKYGEGRFRNCLYVDILEGNELIYDKKIIDTKNDFTINIHIKSGNQIIARDTYQIISTGEDIASSLLTLWSYYPNTTDPLGQNRRLCLEFGKDDNNISQALILNHPKKLNDWIMITISYEASTKQFSVYLDGEIWGVKAVNKINSVKYFGFKRSGWHYENLVVLKKLLTQSEIKAIYEKNRPFVDYSPLTIKAPTPTIVEFNANISSETTR